jgi:hypothetical protein
MPRKKNANSASNYFNESVEQAIQLYNKAETQTERDKLFRIIYPAIYKIAEVMFNKVKPTYMDGEILEIMMDCTSYLSERMYRIKEGKGKAFSYFTVCARNFYIFHNQRAYTGTKKTIKLDYLNENWDIADDTSHRAEEMETSTKLLHAFVDYMDENKDKFVNTKKGNIVVAAVIDFLRDVDSIEDFNRRNIMNDLTEINGYKVDRHYITKVFNRLQMHFGVFSKEWLKTGKSIPFWDKDELTPEEVKFCVENYTPNKGGLSIVGLSKKFNVEEYTVRKELFKAGLAASV